MIIDHWEVDGDLVTLENEIGEGAFGKVFKGTLVKPTSSLPQKFCLKPWRKTAKTINGSETYVVAVKMLHSEYLLFLLLKIQYILKPSRKELNRKTSLLF